MPCLGWICLNLIGRKLTMQRPNAWGGCRYIDAKPRELPPTEPMRITVSEGRHMLEFRRAGYRNIEQRIKVSKTPVHLKLRWIPVKP